MGVTHKDNHEIVDLLAGKCAHLWMFEDVDQRQHSVLDLELEALVVSKFTLCGDTNKGRWRGFEQSFLPETV